MSELSERDRRSVHLRTGGYFCCGEYPGGGEAVFFLPERELSELIGIRKADTPVASLTPGHWKDTLAAHAAKFVLFGFSAGVVFTTLVAWALWPR